MALPSLGTEDSDAVERTPPSSGRCEVQSERQPEIPETGNAILPVDVGCSPETTQENTKEQLAFENNQIAIAVDISSSTKGLVLRTELTAIGYISQGLTESAKKLARVLPWDNTYWNPRPLGDEEGLECGYGTRPGSLVEDGNSPSALTLKDCSLWFLLTDGKISPKEILGFSSSLCAQGIHGTPCVLIVYGRRPNRPMDCNISVGISVFAITPNSILLYHDVEDRQLYVLQYKGCFKAMAKMGATDIMLDERTTWNMIPTIKYSDLFEIVVPRSAPLAKDEMILPSGTRIKLDDVYKDQLSTSQMEGIFANNDDLKSLVLTTFTKGQTNKMKGWLNTQEQKKIDATDWPRPDMDGKASTLVQELLGTFKSDEAKEEKIKRQGQLQALLRQAHYNNWAAFTGIVHLQEDKVRDSTSKARAASSSLTKVVRDNASSASSVSPLDYGDTKTPVHRSKSVIPGLLHVPGFQAGRQNYQLTGFCWLCRAFIDQFAILFCEPLPGQPTQSFPGPSSHTEVLFPLSMANFRETDIVSQIACCDACANIMAKSGAMAEGRKITGALPLVPWWSSKKNTESLTKTVDTALQGRFDTSQLHLILLAVLYNAFDEACQNSTAESRLVAKLTQSACREIGENVKSAFWARSGTHEASAIRRVLIYSRDEKIEDLESLLQQPMDSFILAIRVAFPEEALETASQRTRVERPVITDLILQRLFVHFIEQHLLLRASEGEDAANQQLKSLLAEIEMPLDEHLGTLDLATDLAGNETTCPVVLSKLTESHLLDEVTLIHLRKIGDPFNFMESTFNLKIARFISRLTKLQSQSKVALEIYKELKEPLAPQEGQATE